MYWQLLGFLEPVIQSLKIKFQGHKLPFPQTSHLTGFGVLLLTFTRRPEVSLLVCEGQGEERCPHGQAHLRRRWSVDWNRHQVRKQNSHLVTRDARKWGGTCVLDIASKLGFAFSHSMVMVQYMKLLLGDGISAGNVAALLQVFGVAVSTNIDSL